MTRLLRLAAALLALLALLPALPVQAAAPAALSGVASDAWLLMDAATGQLLGAKNPDKTKYPASITKILTLALTLQHGDLDDTFTVTDTAVAVGYDTAHVALQPGEVITVRDAAMATLLASANDAANCLAEYVSGSMEEFAALMNKTLAHIGCTGTHFTNPSGLPDDGHYTTARDMARITAWALTVPGFRELFATTFYTMPPTNLQPEKRSWGTQNAMIVMSAFIYDGAWGGKLGWTEEARHTMVTALTHDGRELILVTMDSRHKYDKYKDGIAILDSCLEQLEVLELGTVSGPAAPVHSEGELLGNVPFTAEELAVWAPVGTAAGDVQLDWTLPQQLQVGDASPAVLQVTVPAAGSCLPESGFALAVPQGSLAEVAAAWRGQQAAETGLAAWQQLAQQAKEQRRSRVLGAAALVLAGLVLAAFCVRWFNLARRNLRRYGSLRRPRRSHSQYIVRGRYD